MKKLIQNSVIIVLLSVYTILGVAGHFETITIYYFGTNPHNLVHANSTVPQANQIYWTQHKHIPAVIKISVPSPSIITPLINNQIDYFITFVSTEAVIYYQNPEVYFFSSRAPPKA